jgi:hypothetical protein
MTPELKVDWAKSRDGWISLDQFNINSKQLADVSGIYILWSGDTIYKIGYGKIRDEIARDKTDRQITEAGDLMVTWCSLTDEQIIPVMNHLTETLKPAIVDSVDRNSGKKLSINEPWRKEFLLR